MEVLDHDVRSDPRVALLESVAKLEDRYGGRHFLRGAYALNVLLSSVKLLTQMDFSSFEELDLYHRSLLEQFAVLDHAAAEAKEYRPHFKRTVFGQDLLAHDLFKKFLKNIEECKKKCDEYISLIKIRIVVNIELSEDRFIEEAVSFISQGIDKFAKTPEHRKAIWNRIAGDIFSDDDIDTGSVPAATSVTERYSTDTLQGEDVVAFIDRVYGKRGFLTGEFTRADLRKMDPSAAVALNNWEKGNSARPKGRAPLNLPTLKERNDRLLEVHPSLSEPSAKQELKRLLAAARRRQPK